jgi:transposase
MGLIIGVVVLAASAHDNAAGTALLDQVAERCGMRLEKALVDQGFKDEVVIHGALLDIDVEVVRRNPADQGKGFLPQPKRWVVEQTNGTLMLHRRLAREYDHRPDNSASRVYWASTANMARRLTSPGLARHPRTGRVNVAELLADLQSRQDEATARAAELRARIEELAADLTETEARLTDLATTRKIIAEVTPAGTESERPETNTTYQAIVNAFNQHPDQAFRAGELHELLGMPTDEGVCPMNGVTRLG